jgi:hypothetical protein
MFKRLRKLLDRMRVNTGVRVHVWEHRKDRRTDAQREQYRDLVTRRTQELWVGTFGRPAEHDAHVAAREVHKAEQFVDNVLPFKRRAAK